MPELVTILRDEFHTEYVGHTGEGFQFFITGLHNFLALFLFNDAGDLVEAQVDRLTEDNDYESLVQQRLDQVKPVEFDFIEIKPFAVEHYGIMMGLIPNKHDGGEWWVELYPGNHLAFHEPWDTGEYST